MRRQAVDQQRFSFPWFFVLLLPSTWLSAADPVAFAWIDKLSEHAETHRPYQMGFDFEIRFSEHEQTISHSTLVTVRDDRHQHAVSPNPRRVLPNEGQDRKISVVDADWFWTENIPAQGGEHSVVKASMAVIRASKREAPNLPASLVKSLGWATWHLDLRYVGTQNGKVLIEQDLSTDQLAVLGLKYDLAGRPAHLRLEIDAADIFPVTMSVTLGTGPDSQRILYYHYYDFKQLTEVNDDLFAYTPPAGVKVYRLRPFLPAAGGGERGVPPPK